MSANVEKMYSGEGLVPWWVGVESGEAVIMDGLIMAGTGIENTAMQGSAWAALQGISEWADHHKATNLRDGKYASAGDRRAESILWGPAADAKSTALANAIMTPPAATTA